MHRRRITVVVSLGMLIAAVAIGAGYAATRRPEATGPIARVPDLEAQVLAAINTLRRDRGLTTLRPSTVLAAGAREHSMSMAEHGYFSHSWPDGAPFWARGEAGRTFWTVGENIAWASPTLSAGQAVQLWLRSRVHRAILLARAWREIGLGAVHAQAAAGVYGGLEVTILTADFGGSA